MNNPANAPSMAALRKLPSFAWWLVLGLVGLDYFSTLAYLPALAVDDAADMAPFAILGVALLTLFAALPVYLYVAGRSPHGRGATGLLEKYVSGWGGKLFILILLGFIATDFIITRTLSTADASKHLIHNSYWQPQLDWLTQNKDTLREVLPPWLSGLLFDWWSEQMVLTVLFSLIGFAFYMLLLRGFSRAFVYLAAFVVVLFLVLNGIVVGSGLVFLRQHPERIDKWMNVVRSGTGLQIGGVPEEEIDEPDMRPPDMPPPDMPPPEPEVRFVSLGETLAALIFGLLLKFPQLALGMGGLELSMASAPLVRGRPDDDPEHPRRRIRGLRLLLIVAAVLMAVFLTASTFVVTLLVPKTLMHPAQIPEGQTDPAAAVEGPARNRALAYIAHGEKLEGGVSGAEINRLFGPAFGTLYDVSAILILCMAGASVAISLRGLVPEYLNRYGMQMRWAEKIGVILQLFNLVILIVILYFHASVSDQQWAYAGSVLVLLFSASLAVAIDLSSRWSGSAWVMLFVPPFGLIALIFFSLAGLTFWNNPSGLVIALLLIAVTFLTAAVSRWIRSTELRFQGFTFADEESFARWEAIRQLEFQVLVPHRPNNFRTLAEKEIEIRERHRLGAEVPIVFIEAVLGDPSNFLHEPIMSVLKEDGREVVRVTHCASIAHVLAAIALEFREVGRPPEIHFGWSEESPLSANADFLLWGEGNIPWMVHALLRRSERNSERRPRVVIG